MKTITLLAGLPTAKSIAKNTKDLLVVSFVRTSSIARGLAKMIQPSVLRQFVKTKNKAHRNGNSYTPKEKLTLLKF